VAIVLLEVAVVGEEGDDFASMVGQAHAQHFGTQLHCHKLLQENTNINIHQHRHQPFLCPPFQQGFINLSV
jgi:hypothetical protein